MSYINFQIGETFPLPIKAQGDGGIFQYDINGAMFILKLSRSDIIAIESFRTGKIELGLFSADDILFFLYKIDGIANSWGDCPYSSQFHAPDQRPDFNKPQEPVLTLYLVDSRLDLLLAMRSVKLSADFQQKLHEIVQQQSQKAFQMETYAAKVQAIWRKYTSEEMSQQAVIRQEVQLEIPLKSNILHF